MIRGVGRKNKDDIPNLPSLNTLREQMYEVFTVPIAYRAGYLNLEPSRKEGFSTRQSIKGKLPDKDLNFWRTTQLPNPLEIPRIINSRRGPKEVQSSNQKEVPRPEMTFFFIPSFNRSAPILKPLPKFEAAPEELLSGEGVNWGRGKAVCEEVHNMHERKKCWNLRGLASQVSLSTPRVPLQARSLIRSKPGDVELTSPHACLARLRKPFSRSQIFSHLKGLREGSCMLGLEANISGIWSDLMRGRCCIPQDPKASCIPDGVNFEVAVKTQIVDNTVGTPTLDPCLRDKNNIRPISLFEESEEEELTGMGRFFPTWGSNANWCSSAPEPSFKLPFSVNLVPFPHIYNIVRSCGGDVLRWIGLISGSAGFSSRELTRFNSSDGNGVTTLEVLSGRTKGVFGTFSPAVAEAGQKTCFDHIPLILSLPVKDFDLRESLRVLLWSVDLSKASVLALPFPLSLLSDTTMADLVIGVGLGQFLSTLSVGLKESKKVWEFDPYWREELVDGSSRVKAGDPRTDVEKVSLNEIRVSFRVPSSASLSSSLFFPFSVFSSSALVAIIDLLVFRPPVSASLVGSSPFFSRSFILCPAKFALTLSFSEALSRLIRRITSGVSPPACLQLASSNILNKIHSIFLSLRFDVFKNSETNYVFVRPSCHKRNWIPYLNEMDLVCPGELEKGFLRTCSWDLVELGLELNGTANGAGSFLREESSALYTSPLRKSIIPESRKTGVLDAGGGGRSGLLTFIALSLAGFWLCA
ncbi:uncharacterized protein G2W53_012112 [Senna tora]|uniref:Uncharacterized protein n=1 Tax=Senna tora TaxID=362788 RepID=A0A834TXJ3_9FABA|nr:uncharacterized protein G2W53_012112 [Senna tora]